MHPTQTGNEAPTIASEQSIHTDVSLLERDAELDAIHDEIVASTDGSGRLIIIEGPSGIGKSSLLIAADTIGRDLGAQVLTTSGGELEREFLFGLLRRLLEQRVARAEPDERKAIFRGHAGLVESLLQPQTLASEPSLTDEFQLIHSLYWLVVNIADDKPLVLIADDLQWADDQSLQFLLYLAERLGDLPITIIGVVRTGDPEAENELVARLMLRADRSIRPRELSREAIRQLLGALLPEEGADREALVDDSLRATRGNPFLLRELASGIRARPENGLAAVAATAPASVARSVMLRLSRLGDDAVALARAVSILGTSTTPSVAARLARLDFAAATIAADRLASAQIFSDRTELAFYHPMIRSAVYDKYPPDDRARAHLEAARLLSEQQVDHEGVAVHLMRGAPTEGPWARTALQSAARSAGRKGAPGTAVGYLRRALEMPAGAAQENASLLFDLGIMEAAAGERTSLSHLERALQLTEDPDDRARAMFGLGQTLFRYGRAAEARTVFRRGADAFHEVDRDTALRFEAGYAASATYLIQGLREAHDRVAALAESFPEPERLSPAERLLVLHMVVFRAMSEPRSAEHAELALRALGDGVQLWRATSDAMTISHAMLALTWCGYAAEAAQFCERALAEARTRGDSLVFAELSLARSMAMSALGRVGDAMVDAQAAIIGMRRGWKSTVPAPQGLLAYCLIERGELDEADAVIDVASRSLRDGETETLNVWFYMARGRLRLARGTAQEAAEDFLHAGALLEARSFMNPGYMLIPWRSSAGLALHAAGHPDRARELIDRDIVLARQFDLPSTLGAALRCRALVAAGGPDTTLLAQSADVLSHERSSPLELARTLVELGAAQRRAGQRVRSRDALRRALDLAHHAEATDLERRAHEELLASGARPRRAVLEGPDALTPSEQRIANLMATGATAREVAESLYLTISTVGWHRRNIYRKLGIGSRDELADALAAQ